MSFGAIERRTIQTDVTRTASWFGMRKAARFLLLAYTLLFLRIAVCEIGSSEFQSKVRVRLVWAVAGDDVELPCDVTPPTPNDIVSMVLWFKNNVGIPLYSLDARSGALNNSIHWAVSDDLGKRTYFQVADGHRARLKINKVTYNDQGMFRCRVDFVNSPTRNFLVNLTLVEQPTKPVIYDAQGREVTGIGGPFLEGYDLSLACQVSSGRPKPKVTWWKDGELIDAVIDSPINVGSSSKFTVNYLFIGKVTRSLCGAKLECRAQSGPMGTPVIREVPLDIYLKPAMVKIVLNEDQIYAGQPIGARCETWGSSPAASIIWKLGGSIIRDFGVTTMQMSNSTVSKLVIVFERDDDGRELTCRAENPRFPGGVLEETRMLRIFYSPIVTVRIATGYILDTLREGDDLKLVCDVQSNPRPTNIFWYHDGSQLEHNVTAGTLVASNTLTLRVLTLAHSGEYSCIAMNSVGEMRSLPILIHMKYAPKCKDGFERQEVTAIHHETLLLRCDIEAVPSNTVRFSWTYNGTQRDVLPIPNFRIQNKDLTSTLEYTPTSDSNFGTLACWASNSVGKQRTPCIFNIVPVKIPQPPLDCSLHNETSSLEVNCMPGSDGGSPQQFVLEVRGHTGLLQALQSDQGVVGEVPTIYQERNAQPIFRLHDLEPGFDYTVVVYALNNRGRSKPVLLENIRVVEPIDNMEKTGIFLEDLKVIPQVSLESMFVITALIGAVVLIIVGIGVVIGLAICKRRSNPPAREGPDDFITPSYVSTQGIESRIRYSSDRKRTQRTSLYVEENRNEPGLLQQVEGDLQRS